MEDLLWKDEEQEEARQGEERGEDFPTERETSDPDMEEKEEGLGASSTAKGGSRNEHTRIRQNSLNIITLQLIIYSILYSMVFYMFQVPSTLAYSQNLNNC